jgi:anthranilate synthase/aminodeoxychorismate synthase-like glutamine amidotransferase
MLLLIDNYDSFVHNLARYFQQLGQETFVIRNDAIDTAGVRQMAPQAIVFSPGPCSPNEAGCCLDVVRHFWSELPMLGVCLGHQAIAAACGGKIRRAGQPMHGRASEIRHNGAGIFRGAPNPLVAGRYHSLSVESQKLPDCLEATAFAADGELMALRAKERPIVGVQFHPESILTPVGYLLLNNFLELARLASSKTLPDFETERCCPEAKSETLPIAPVTF